LTVFILHPQGRISEIQRRQMTTVGSENIHNIAIDGTFDDCQALVKALFADGAFRTEIRLAAINSINWVRVMAQCVYYFSAGLALGAPEREVVFSVPTGNFGDVYAGHVARHMGLPIRRLLVATNRNDILARFFESGVYRKSTVEPSLSPSMDIQVASNFERFLFELLGRNGAAAAALMADFSERGEFALDARRMAEAQALYRGFRVDDAATLATIAAVARESGRVVDPHSATGIAAAKSLREGDEPVVCLATAHPAKFPDAVEQATGERPVLPARLADLMTRPEWCSALPNELGALRDHIRSAARAGQGLREGVA
jgi:threonine synthase